jgi:hypothetical protein
MATEKYKSKSKKEKEKRAKELGMTLAEYEAHIKNLPTDMGPAASRHQSWMDSASGREAARRADEAIANKYKSKKGK